jgi:carboxypeptidase Q
MASDPRSLGHCATPMVIALALLVAGPVTRAQERVDYDAIHRIKAEGFERSEVMELASYLTDVHGPRLTGSPNARAAADFTIGRLKEWGLANVRLEWFPFGRGWSNQRTVAHAVSPQAFPIIAYSKAWTPGLEGPLVAEAVMAVVEREEDFETFRGRLRGKFVLTQPVPEVRALFDPPGRRYSDRELAELASHPDPRPAPAAPPAARVGAAQEFARKRMAFFLEEGVAALVDPGRGRGDSGSVMVVSGGSRNPSDPPVAPQVVFATEHYGRIARLLDRDIAVTLELDIQNTFHDEQTESFNILAEIPGTDKADEVVMLGAHFDSWHAGTGATDNAAGSAAMLEAIRILQASGLPMRRIVRLALWTGEEQGLLGSRAYVREHFADRETMKLQPAHGKLSAYFNIDNGGGALRGIYLQGNHAVAPIFEAWMKPFRDLGMTTLTIRNTGGTDHLAFDAVGLPGFQFIQDPLEYSTRSHHSNMDLYERLQAADMMKNAVIAASFVYHAANRDEPLPRKPLPPPQPPVRPATTTSQGL